MDNNTQAFLALVRAGLWGQDVHLSQYGNIDYKGVYRLAEEQTVVGLVAAGIEHIQDVKVPQDISLVFVGNAVQLEQRNTAMNSFIAELVGRLQKKGITTLLVKGQGIAQCYLMPLWRACGDIDLFLDEDNYEKAKDFLIPLASSLEKEAVSNKHLGLTMGPWEIELHGTMHGELLKRVDYVIDQVQIDCFSKGRVRIWHNDKVDILLPAHDNDIILVFTHILQHYFERGIGLRQICDWCRLLWTFRDRIDRGLLKDRLKRMGLISEWKSFAALAVNYMGIPVEAMPLYSSSFFWRRKSDRILRIIMMTGNFGHNKADRYYEKKSFIGKKCYSFWRHTSDSLKQSLIFPKDSFLIWCNIVKTGLGAILKH